MPVPVQESLRVLTSGSVGDKIKILEGLSHRTEMNTELGKMVLDLVDETVKGRQTPKTMSPLMKALLKAIIVLNSDLEIRQQFLEGNVLLERLILWLNKEFELAELQLVLNTIEVICKGAGDVVWRPPSIRSLVHTCLELIIRNRPEGTSFIHAVKILVYLCRDSSTCFLIARGDIVYKTAWTVLSEIVFQTPPTSAHSRKVIVAAHLMFLLETGYNSSLLQWGFRHANVYAIKLLAILVDPVELSKIDGGGVCHFAELVGFLDTLIAQANNKLNICGVMDGVKPSGADIPQELLEEGRNCKKMVVQLSKSLLTVLCSSIRLFQKREHSDSAADLIVILTPTFIPFVELKEPYRLAYAAMIELMFGPQQSRLQKPRGFLAYLHLLTGVVECGDGIVTEFKTELLAAVQNIELYRSSNREDLDMHITCCRILSVISRVPFLADEFKRILDVEALDGLLCSFVKIPIQHKENHMKETTFVIEALGLLSENTKSPALRSLLLKYILDKRTTFHIVAGILCGDQKLVIKTLILTGSVSLSRDSLNALGKTLSGMRAGVGHIVPPRLNFNSTTFSPLAAQGLIKLEESLEFIALTYNTNNQLEESSGALIAEVVALQEVKNLMHETETQTLRDQLHETGHLIIQLRLMVEKQSELMVKKLSSVEQKDQQILLLSHQLEVAKLERIAQKAERDKEAKHLVEQIAFKSEKMATYDVSLGEACKRIEDLTQETTELTKRVIAAEQGHVVTQGNVDKLTQEAKNKDKILNEQRQKISVLEQTVRNKDEEKKRLERELEKEKRTVDMIRGLLGNNLGNMDLS